MTEKKVKRDDLGRFAKGKKGGPGRPKKIKGTARPFEDMIRGYEQLGGIAELVRWAKQNNSNRVEFYRLLFRTVPQKTIEKLLLPQDQESPITIQYVSIDLDRQRLRIAQLEEFIRDNSLEVPDEPKRTSQADDNVHENGDKKQVF